MILDQLLHATAGRVAGLPESEEHILLSKRRKFSLISAIAQEGQGNRIISEIKFASPSRGLLRGAGDPVVYARDFAGAGAAALSILTEPSYFHGDPSFIPAVRPHVQIPLLRKDFIIDERQLAESRALGADAVLLIAGVLGSRLEDMVDSALAYGLEPLVEVHRMEEVKRALSTSTRLAGINNRDLLTMRIDLSTTMRLAPSLRESGLTVVSESGIIWPCDIRALRPFADAFLIGTAIMGSRDPVQRLEGFVST